MKPTIDIPLPMLKEAMRNAKTGVKRDAVLAALEDYNRRGRLKSLAESLEGSESFMSAEKLMKMRLAEVQENHWVRKPMMC